MMVVKDKVLEERVRKPGGGCINKGFAGYASMENTGTILPGRHGHFIKMSNLIHRGPTLPCPNTPHGVPKHHNVGMKNNMLGIFAKKWFWSVYG